MPLEAGPVREQVPDRHLRVGVGVGEAELGQVLLHEVVPAEGTLVDEHARERGGEGLGAGRKGEKGARRDRLGTAELLDAVALQHDGPAVLDQDEGGARNLPGREGLGHDSVRGGRGENGRGFGSIRRGERRTVRHECQHRINPSHPVHVALPAPSARTLDPPIPHASPSYRPGCRDRKRPPAAARPSSHSKRSSASISGPNGGFPGVLDLTGCVPALSSAATRRLTG